MSPAVVGLKVTLISHDEPTDSDEPQVVVMENGPPIVGLSTETTVFPVLVSVAESGAEDAPTVTGPNVNVAGARDAVGVPAGVSPPEPEPVGEVFTTRFFIGTLYVRTRFVEAACAVLKQHPPNRARVRAARRRVRIFI
jgi:hypothetical protein